MLLAALLATTPAFRPLLPVHGFGSRSAVAVMSDVPEQWRRRSPPASATPPMPVGKVADEILSWPEMHKPQPTTPKERASAAPGIHFEYPKAANTATSASAKAPSTLPLPSTNAAPMPKASAEVAKASAEVAAAMRAATERAAAMKATMPPTASRPASMPKPVSLSQPAVAPPKFNPAPNPIKPPTTTQSPVPKFEAEHFPVPTFGASAPPKSTVPAEPTMQDVVEKFEAVRVAAHKAASRIDWTTISDIVVAATQQSMKLLVEEAPKALEGASSTAASLINASAANVQKGQEISVMGRAFLELGMLKVQEAFETEVRT